MEQSELSALAWEDEDAVVICIHIFTLFILIDYPIHVYTMSIELSILYFKGSQLKISIKRCNSIKIVFIQANSKDPDEMHPYVAFHLQCLPEYQE